MTSRLRSLVLGKTLASSSGPESSSVQRSIDLGDEARDRQEWAVAEKHFFEALSKDGTLAGIWVQLGHMRKEQGRLASAAAAYGRAIKLEPQDAETHIHAAHIFKRSGETLLAIRHFLKAIYLGLESETEQQELLTLLEREAESDIDALLESVRSDLEQLPESGVDEGLLSKLRLLVETPSEPDTLEAGREADATAIVYDISDLIGFWHRARLPTGIQRVQIETVAAELSLQRDREVRICCFTSHRDNWLEVPLSIFTRLVELSTDDGAIDDEVWQQALFDLNLHLVLSRPFSFPEGAMLINLGTSWWLQNYFLFVRHAKQTHNIRYVPFVHDLIPIMAPQHCTRELTQDFISWAMAVFDHADHFLANSLATRRDLIQVAKTLGHELEEQDVAVIPLDSDFRRTSVEDLPEDEIAKWGLEQLQFVLFVSTIESRKGHLIAFEAWTDLIDKLGAENVPKFVCVGNDGWLNDEIYARLAAGDALSDHVVMLSKLSDAELALLYRTCLFTLYPSTYEGWGLPVTESLCYGKVPLISDAASLPEAGGNFAVYFSSGSSEELVRKAERLITDADYLDALQNRIAAEFAPRRWKDVAGQIITELTAFELKDKPAKSGKKDVNSAPLAHVGRWHSMTRNVSTEIWRGMSSAEKYRSNLSWFWPEDRGCRVKQGTGELTFRLESAHEGLELFFELNGDENERCHYVIECDGSRDEGTIEAGDRRWAVLELAASSSPKEYRITCSAIEHPGGNRPTYFVMGFYPCLLHDQQQHSEFMKALTLNRLDRLDAFGRIRAAA